MTSAYRELPSVDRLLSEAAVHGIGGLPGAVRAELAREVLAAARAGIAEGRACPPLDALVGRLIEAAARLRRGSLRPVINATGVIIHTNLGRAPLSDDALAAMHAAGAGYSNLEFDLDRGERGSRYSHLDELLRRVSGAEAGIAVNNNASALLLTLSALAIGREVIISRSQVVEIGGGFRIPDVMRQSGARLIEVGTTNRTYLRDFAEATTAGTVAYLRVHASNFRVIGFTTFPELAGLAALAHDNGALLIDDLGSGCLLPVDPYGLAPEPMVQASINAGVDLALFSGDKLLGGPQAGIIVGRAELIQQLRSHPLARAVRLDKTSIAGLAATLLHYLQGEALEKVPVWRMIAAPLANLRARTHAWALQLGAAASVVPGRSMIGGGSLPEESLPTALLSVLVPAPNGFASRLRRGDPTVVARVEADRVLLDPRTVDPRDDERLLRRLQEALTVP